MMLDLYYSTVKGYRITAYYEQGMSTAKPYEQFKISKCNNKSVNWRTGITTYQECLEIINKHLFDQSRTFNLTK